MESSKALLVLGMTRSVLGAGAGASIAGVEALVEAVSGEIAYFRERRRPVIFFVPAPAGAPAAALVEQVLPELRPDPLDGVMPLPSLSAFYRTGLDEWLALNPVDRLTIVGVRAHVEVLFTAADAFQRGIGLVVPSPCVGSARQEEVEIALRQLRQVLLQPHPGEPVLGATPV